jgi:lysozyme
VSKTAKPKLGLLEAEEIVFNLLRYELNDNQFSALVSFILSEGEYLFRRSALLRMINEGDILQASKCFLRYTMRRGKTVNTLVKLRKAEKKLFLMPIVVINNEAKNDSSQQPPQPK